MELVLLLCAFMTLAAVLSAAFVACCAAYVIYAWQQQLRDQIEQMPGEWRRQLEKAVQEYVKPFKEEKEEEERLEQFRYQPNEDDEQWPSI